jgi:putative flippase GtrA
MVRKHVERIAADPEARAAFKQLVRYGIVGVLITTLGQAVYFILAETGTTSPLVAIAIAWIVGVTVGYFAHGWVSFAGHGARDDHAAMSTRFAVVNVIGYVLNSFWVWLLVERLGGPTWWPIPPNVILTPLMTFWLHRHWTFR